jgi:hypothetical protein
MRWAVVAVRVRIRVEKTGGARVEAIALLNSGYETLEPELLVNKAVAEALGILPELPPGSVVKEYVLADGSISRLIKVPKSFRVYVVEEDRVVGGVEASIVISERADELLISDKLAGALGIVVLDFAEGLWCFRDEIGRRVRKTKKKPV